MRKPELPLAVPQGVYSCPYCQSPLVVESIDGTTECDGRWIVDSISITCKTEPAVKSREWKWWLNKHSAMPYANWLPAQGAIIGWLNQNFDFGKV